MSGKGSCDSIFVSANTTFTITCSASWLDFSSKGNENSKTITITANSTNTGSDVRNGRITVNMLGLKRKYITVIQESESTGINLTSNSEIIIVPNPVSDVLKVSGSGNSTYSIIGIEGRKVLSGMLKSGLGIIEVNALPAGIYIINITSEKGVQTGKFVKE